MLPSRNWMHPNYWRNLSYNNSVTLRHWNHPNYWRNLFYNNSVTFKTLKSSQLLTKSSYNNSVTFKTLKSSVTDEICFIIIVLPIEIIPITDEICLIIIVLPSGLWIHPNYWRNLFYNNSFTFKTLKSSQLLTKSVL